MKNITPEIDFEQEFSEFKVKDTKENKRQELKNKNKLFYWISLFSFLVIPSLISVILMLFAFPIITRKPNRYLTPPPKQIIIELYKNPNNQLGLISKKDALNSFTKEIKDSFITPDFIDDNYVFIIPKEGNVSNLLLKENNEKNNKYEIKTNYLEIINEYRLLVLTDILDLNTNILFSELIKDNIKLYEVKTEISLTDTNLLNEILSQRFLGTFQLIGSLTVAGIIIGLLWKDLVYDFKYKFSKSVLKSLLFVIGGVVLSFACMELSELLMMGLAKASKIDLVGSANQKAIIILFQNPSQAVIMKICVVLLAPMIEELTFRKSLFSIIKNKKMAIYVSSLSFGLIHVIDMIKTPDLMMLNLIPYLFGGLVLSLIYVLNKKNIYVPIMAHMLINLLGVIG